MEMENRCNSFDVTLKVDDVEISANKKILAASSPYFRTMFEHFQEKDQETVEIGGFSSEILTSIIHHVYTSEILITEENVQDLLIAASYLQFADICDVCIEFLTRKLHPTNCLGVQMFAEMHGLQDLFDTAQHFMHQNFTKVTKSEEFLNLSINKVSEIISSDLLNVEEEKVFESILNWIRHDLISRHRQQHLIFLMRNLRFCCMPITYINKTLLKEPLLRICPNMTGFVQEFLEPFYAKGDPKTITDKCGQFRGPNKILLVVGGTKNKCIDCYDLKKGTLSKLSEFPGKDVRGAAATVMNGKIYVLGGKSRRRVDVYDPATDSWNRLTKMRSPRTLLGVATLGNYIYAVGGYDNGNMVERIDPKTGRSTNIAPMKSKREAHGVGVVNGLLYAVGGVDGNTDLKSVECYNPIRNTWRNVNDMHFRRMGVGVGVLQGILYAVGGCVDETILNSVEAFNPETGNWILIGEMHVPRWGTTVVAINNLLYAVGGATKGRNKLDSMEVYDPSTNIWTLLPNCMSVKRLLPLVAVIDLPDHIIDC